MAGPLIVALDEGTTSTRAIAFDLTGAVVASEGAPLTQSYPQPGWVEHDPVEIWERSAYCLRTVAGRVGAERIAAIGITNQRETAVLWSRSTGRPFGPAIVWQDRRTADACARLREAGLEPELQARTGLLLDPYFSGTKIAWACHAWPDAAAAARSGDLAVGTVDSWLLWNLTGGRSHATDATNASRTLLMDLETRAWVPALAEAIGVPLAALPEIVDSAGRLGETSILGSPIPIGGIAGDQQAATIGQGALAPGQVKSTYGTGIFALANAGDVPPRSANRLLGTVLSTVGGKGSYALEGSIFVGGSAVQWLRDGLRIIDSAAETEALARSVPDTAGVHVVPAFAGLGAPHWQPHVRGLITGLSAGVTRAHIARATLEAMSHQTADLLDAMAGDGVRPTTLNVDGGMVANEWLCQDLADLLGLTVARPRCIETTAMGAAMLAGVGAGLFVSLEEAATAMVAADRTWEPRQPADQRAARRAGWQAAVAKAMAGEEMLA